MARLTLLRSTLYILLLHTCYFLRTPCHTMHQSNIRGTVVQRYSGTARIRGLNLRNTLEVKSPRDDVEPEGFHGQQKY